jgi:hypothetical protein
VLLSNTTGSDNTANGYLALAFNTTGHDNTANGFAALYNNTTGNYNTANGSLALLSNTTGSANTANGYQALYTNDTGNHNTADGYGVLFSNTAGRDNTANGYLALAFNTTGHDNTANGFAALYNNTTGGSNIAVGNLAGSNLTTGDNNIDIGNVGVAAEASTIRIGDLQQIRAFIAGIFGVNEGGTISAVYINSDGQLGTQPPPSSRRFKKEIRAMDQTSQAILGLQPVTFQYKSDTKGTAQFGLIAEEVAKVDPNLVVRDAEGEIYSVRYEAVNAMLLNEFLKEYKKVEDLEKDLRATIVQQQKEIEALTMGLQKVSAQLELRKPAPQTVANNQ